jgi:putative ABC transport system permease protein
MAYDIKWIDLIIGSTLIFIPVALILYAKLKLLKDLILSMLRMTIQLLFVGFYLKYIIDYDNIYINIFWILLIVIVGSISISKRSEVELKFTLVPVITGFSFSFVIVTFFTSYFYFSGMEYFTAQYLIPISGMLIGNSISSSIVAIRSLTKDLIAKKELINYYEIFSFSRIKSTKESMNLALLDSFKPMLANIANIGLIWLPGTMTGQIISGTNPMTAIKYQIVIVIGYFACCFIATFISLNLFRTKAFDNFGILKIKM